MTSLARQIQRRNPNFEKVVRPQLTEDLPDGGYKTLHPTKGWKYTSDRRIKARQEMFDKFKFVR